LERKKRKKREKRAISLSLSTTKRKRRGGKLSLFDVFRPGFIGKEKR